MYSTCQEKKREKACFTNCTSRDVHLNLKIDLNLFYTIPPVGHIDYTKSENKSYIHIPNFKTVGSETREL